MIKRISTVLLFLFPFSVKAQITETITVKAGEDLSAVLSTHGLYKFPAFNSATVLFKDGTTTRAKMNFNIFLNDMQFIDNKGDTLVVSNPELIDSIKFDSTVFYYQKGYLQVVEDYGSTKLVVQKKISFQPVKKGAFGLSAPGASIDTYGRLSASFNGINQLVLNEDIIVTKMTSYIVTYKKYRSATAKRSGFLTAFPEIKKETQDFIDLNKINFNKEDDLKKLLQFCTQHS